MTPHTLAGEPLEPLHPRYLGVIRAGTALAALPMLVAVIVGDAVLSANTALPFGLLASGAALVLILWVLLSPGRRFRAWGYRLDGDELNLASGLLWRRHVIVPLQRVQHIDLEQGPLERRVGLAELVVHTAGTHGAKVTVPGLALTDAEALRDRIRAHIRQEAE